MNNTMNTVIDPLTGLPVEKQQNQAVYGNAKAQATANTVFGSPEARNASVAFVPQPPTNPCRPVSSISSVNKSSETTFLNAFISSPSSDNL